LKPWLASAAAGFIVTALASTAADAVMHASGSPLADVRFAPNSRQIADISACPLCACQERTLAAPFNHLSQRASDFAERQLWNVILGLPITPA
jgi:hypothetical protein